jgi:hypothetical protein
MSRISRIGQRVRIMWNTSVTISTVNRSIAGIVAGALGAVAGGIGLPVHLLLIVAIVGGASGYLASAILWFLVTLLSPPKLPSPLPPVNEARLLSVIEESGAVSLLCPSCLGRLAQGGLDVWVEMTCVRCQAMARHRELQERAEARMRFGAAMMNDPGSRRWIEIETQD